MPWGMEFWVMKWIQVNFSVMEKTLSGVFKSMKKEKK